MLLLVAVLVAALLVARSCGSRETTISKEEAVEIARKEIDFRPDQVVMRFVPRGVPESRPSWAISFSSVDADGRYEHITVVVVDGRTGEVLQVTKQQ